MTGVQLGMITRIPLDVATARKKFGGETRRHWGTQAGRELTRQGAAGQVLRHPAREPDLDNRVAIALPARLSPGVGEAVVVGRRVVGVRAAADHGCEEIYLSPLWVDSTPQ